MLRLTTQAAQHLSRLRRERRLDDTATPRFIRRAGRLKLTFASGPWSGDRVVDSGQISTLVAPSAADLLDSATIDVGEANGRAHLVVRHDDRVPAARDDRQRTGRRQG